MILFSILAGLGAAAAIMSLLDRFYDDIINWLKVVGNTAKRLVQGVLIGCKTFINAGRATFRAIGKEISKNYSKVGDKWQVTEVERNVSPEEIPDEIYEKSEQISDDELELTQDIEAQILANYQ